MSEHFFDRILGVRAIFFYKNSSIALSATSWKLAKVVE